MKLLKTFTNQLAACGDLKRVWVTSFNIDIEFIETFVLPAVLGAEQPRTRVDYEALQHALNESGIDFRVFCDKRYISTDQNKRTLIPVHGISPEKAVDGKKSKFSEDRLFHAKVIYIEGQEGRVLGAGSANLTLSGWGRQREVFHFVPIDEQTLYYSVFDFFKYLFANVDEEFPLARLRKFHRKSPRATFCHSLQKEAFLKQLFEGRQHEKLAVWSPYLSRDLASLVKHIRQQFEQPNLKLMLAADRIEGGCMRTKWSNEVGQLLDSGELSLFEFPYAQDDRINMTHAKLWKTEDRLAIGSWNCTRAGSNSWLDDKGDLLPDNNIEAGLILKDKDAVEEFLGDPLKVGMDLFASVEQLDDEALDVPETLPFDIRVSFDWSSQRYKVTGHWNKGQQHNERYAVKLPDVDKPVPLSWHPRKATLREVTLRVTHPKQILSDHRFEILEGDESQGTGLLIEINGRYRRAQKFDDLKSLFDAMAEGRQEPSIDELVYRVSDEDEEGRAGGDGEISPQAQERTVESIDISQISYFRLFAATFQYSARLREINDIKTLDYWVFTRPGCLEELVSKTNERIVSGKPSVFNWFLAKEVEALCRLALKKRGALEKGEDAVALERWSVIDVCPAQLPPEADGRYVAMLEQEFEQMARSWGVA